MKTINKQKNNNNPRIEWREFKIELRQTVNSWEKTRDAQRGRADYKYKHRQDDHV